jgi:putative resolvase
MKLSDWARSRGISYKTAWLWWRDGKLPVAAEQMATGTILVSEGETASGSAGLYARVSSSEQRNDLEGQLGRLVTYAAARGWQVGPVVGEIGSGLNGHRPKLIKLLSDPMVSRIVVEHRDRLMRFGAEYVEAALAAQGRTLVVMNETEVKDDLVQDMIEVLTSFCARLYGRRSARNKAKKAVESMANSSRLA